MIHVMYWYHVIPLQNAKTPIPGNIGINVLLDVNGLNKKINVQKDGKMFSPWRCPDARAPLKTLSSFESIDIVVKHVTFVVGAYLEHLLYTKYLQRITFSVSLQLLKSAKLYFRPRNQLWVEWMAKRRMFPHMWGGY